MTLVVSRSPTSLLFLPLSKLLGQKKTQLVMLEKVLAVPLETSINSKEIVSSQKALSVITHFVVVVCGPSDIEL